jgi:hypothetical protein
MKKAKQFILATCIALLATSCSTTMTVAVSRAELGDKKGVSNTIVVFGIQLNGDYSVGDAAKNGNITGPIATVDVKSTNYILFQQKQIIVTAK